MPNIRTDGWAKIEGAEISNLAKQYGTFNNIPNSQQHVYYGSPEIQIENPYSDIHSSVYSVQYIDEKFGYTQILEIDNNWNNFKNNIQAWMSTHVVDIDESNTSYYYVGKPFIVDKSCVIFYDDSTKTSKTGSKYTHYSIILIDEAAVPNVVSITAEYDGGAVPIGEQFDETLLTVTAVYDDGNSNKIKSGYIIDPSDKIVTQLGSNVFDIYYTDPESDVNKISFLVQGIRNLDYIAGYWDGGYVGYGKEAAKKFFVIVATYTDGTQNTVSKFSFPNGNIVSKTNNGLIDIYYEGKTCQVQVKTFDITESSITAFYSGPNVEVGHEYQKSYIKVKVFYTSSDGVNSYYEDIDIEDCKLSSTTVSYEGLNSYILTYTGKLGDIHTSFTVNGFKPEVKPTDIDVQYSGPAIYQGGSIDIERVICNILYSDGKTKNKRNFSLSTNTISNIGPNEITVTYKEDGTTLSGIIVVEGLENDSTTQNNIFPTELDNMYPTATFLNNRYRGPAEGIKTNDYANMIIDNITNLYSIFVKLEKQYNKIVDDVTNNNNIKIMTLNNVSYIEHQCNTILNDDHYSTGVYKMEES